MSAEEPRTELMRVVLEAYACGFRVVNGLPFWTGIARALAVPALDTAGWPITGMPGPRCFDKEHERMTAATLKARSGCSCDPRFEVELKRITYIDNHFHRKVWATLR